MKIGWFDSPSEIEAALETAERARAAGFMWAVYPPEGRSPIDLGWDVLNQGVIARPMSDVIGFCPPLVSTEAQVDQTVDALAAVV